MAQAGRDFRKRLRGSLPEKDFAEGAIDRKSTRLNSSHLVISYAVFCLKKNTTEKWMRAGSESGGGGRVDQKGHGSVSLGERKRVRRPPGAKASSSSGSRRTQLLREATPR